MSSTDVESLQSSSRQRSRCLDWFLISSVIVLFVLVLSGAALGLWIVKDLRAEMERLPGAPEGIFNHLKSPGGQPNLGSSYKVENFAYVISMPGKLKNGSMQWDSITYGNTSTIGSRYSYDSNQHALKVHQDGTYFLYTQLNLTCTGPCASGSLSVTFKDNMGREHLSCSLHLKHVTPPKHLVESCWTVIPRLTASSRLMARMQANVPPEGWKLDPNHSGFGMFLVDGP